MTTIELKNTTTLEDYRKAGGNPDSGENQHICGRLVDREVLHCISSTVSALNELCADAKSDYVDYDELMDLSRGYEYEEPAKEHVDEMDRSDVIDWLTSNSVELPNEFGELNPEEDDEDAEELDAGGHLTDEELRQLLIDNCSDWKDFCEQENIEPHDIDVYEHWAVTGWFMKRLAEHGEVTGDLLDFNVWGRSCTGQAIKLDHVIQSIAAEMQILDGQANSWKD